MKTTPLQQKKKTSRGFTIVEMVVVISIFGVLASLVLFRYKSFQSAINLENTTQDIALQVQQAQNYAVAGRYPSLAQGQGAPLANWRPSYGVYFDTSTAANTKKLAFFFDKQSQQPGDANFALEGGPEGRGYFNDNPPFSTLCGAAQSECLNLITITDDTSIEKICQGLMSECTNNSQGNPLGTNISLVFTRPFPERIAYVLQSGTPIRVTNNIRIRVKSDTTGKSRDIVITPLGQIHIETVTQ